ncbi:hypothetical protein NUBL21996_41570 [Klebsiella pneumoniae]|nr:hypothetical protein NUBL21996_41570 [Klebsiella pneumoniae]HCI8777115.1 hypothetical protein [Klebsiella pneumoniae]HCI8882506.1 hypothetical protein [Klebsiella pneumoniae]
MITLYMPGNAEIIDGISVDYISVEEQDVDALKNAGWVENISELEAEKLQ